MCTLCVHWSVELANICIRNGRKMLINAAEVGITCICFQFDRNFCANAKMQSWVLIHSYQPSVSCFIYDFLTFGAFRLDTLLPLSTCSKSSESITCFPLSPWRQKITKTQIHDTATLLVCSTPLHSHRKLHCGVNETCWIHAQLTHIQLLNS